MKPFWRLKVTARLCTLAILGAAVLYVWFDSKAAADSNTVCAQCDSRNIDTLSNCNANWNSCYSGCQNQLSTCINAGNLFCDDQFNTCSSNCATTRDNCQSSSWSTYDNCLYGFSDGSGFCAVTDQNGTIQPSGKGKTPCDFACRDQFIQCGQNGGLTCGQDFNDCKLGCG